ncbi:adenylate/guanylate cyclase domain-containing protein [Methylobacterium sp. P31]
MDRVVERRLAAILITDVVGYSRMISSDEAGTLRRLKALRREVIDPRIAAARGRVVKSTGDGVLAEFPSSVRAVTCAIEIQRAAALHNASLPEGQVMQMRIGINLGDVIAEPDGDLYGDGVNVAARLEPLAEPGGLCISRSIHDQVRDRLPFQFEDRGKLALKNIARPIGVFALSAAAVRDLPELAEEETYTDVVQAAPAAATLLQSAAPPSLPRRPARWPLLGAGALVLVATGFGLGWWTWPKTSLGDKTLAVQAGLPAKPLPPLSLVVLPFANLSADPEQEFFADGLTEDLTTDLSHLSGSFIIARNTAFTYKGKAVDVKQLGRDLGVRYALEGSVRRSGEKVVLNAQLISTETGAHLWADRFEGESNRLGELQADFVARLARSLDVQLIQAESLRSLRERPNHPDATDLSMRGWSAVNRPRSLSNLNEAIAFFERALAIDPESFQGRLGLARAMMAKVSGAISSEPTADTARADTLIAEILAVDPANAMAHLVKGEIYRARKQLSSAILETDIAVSSNKNLAVAWQSGGTNRMMDGRAAESFAFYENAIRLSPKDPSLNVFEYAVCHSHTHLKHWDKAIEWCSKSVAHGPFWLAYIDLAAAYAWTGRGDEAKQAVAEILKLKPGYTVQKWANMGWSNNPTFLAEYAYIVEGLRKAGLPEN